MQLQKIIKSNKGLSLVELLAVMVILGILAVIAVLTFTKVVEQSRMKAFVSSAVGLSESTRLYIHANPDLVDTNTNMKIDYGTVFTNGYIEKIQDPITKEFLDPTTNESYVEIVNGKIDSVCFYGSEHNLCMDGDNNQSPIKIGDLTVDAIRPNPTNP